MCKHFRGSFSHVVPTVDAFSLKAGAPWPPDIKSIAVKQFQIIVLRSHDQG